MCVTTTHWLGCLPNTSKKDAFHWDAEVDKAFQRLKSTMISLPILALLDFSNEFVIETDASGLWVGAILMQGERPVAFYNQTFSPTARTRFVYKRELMAIVFAIKKWRPYVLRKHFVV